MVKFLDGMNGVFKVELGLLNLVNGPLNDLDIVRILFDMVARL